MPIPFLFLPPQGEKTRDWARRLGEAVPQLEIIAPETIEGAEPLIAHPVAITNFREIYNDHIAAHIMSFVLAFARGLHVYIPQQLRREWRPMGRESDDIVTHLP